MDKNNVKRKQLVETIYVELRCKFRTNPHHDDYRQIIHAVIVDFCNLHTSDGIIGNLQTILINGKPFQFPIQMQGIGTD